MKHQEFSRKTQDGYTLHTNIWEPDDGIQGLLVLVHGLGEHSGRYQHVAEFFTSAHYALLTWDLRGHGQSSGMRGHSPTYEIMVDDVEQTLQDAQKRYPNLSCFLYGHSMGGEIALYFGMTRKPIICGVIVTSPGLAPAKKVPGWKNQLGNILYRIFPSAPLDNGLDIDGISRDTQVVSVYKADPLVHSKVSARLGLDLIRTGDWLTQQPAPFPLPLLLLQGSADRIVSRQAVEQFAQNMSKGGELTYHIFEGGYHELHNEPEKNTVLTFILNWMEKQIPSPAENT